jgi:naphthoate synthase
VNKVVPADELLAEACAWGREAAALSPTALKFLKASFNADSMQSYGQGKLAFAGLESFGKSEEASEGRRAFAEKRAPDFSKFR